MRASACRKSHTATKQGASRHFPRNLHRVEVRRTDWRRVFVRRFIIRQAEASSNSGGRAQFARCLYRRDHDGRRRGLTGIACRGRLWASSTGFSLWFWFLALSERRTGFSPCYQNFPIQEGSWPQPRCRERRPARQFSGGSVQHRRCLLTRGLDGRSKTHWPDRRGVCPERSRSPIPDLEQHKPACWRNC